jgi:hypothetical protein
MDASYFRPQIGYSRTERNPAEYEKNLLSRGSDVDAVPEGPITFARHTDRSSSSIRIPSRVMADGNLHRETVYLVAR